MPPDTAAGSNLRVYHYGDCILMISFFFEEVVGQTVTARLCYCWRMVLAADDERGALRGTQGLLGNFEGIGG
jgi:hypothetical protein